MSKKKRVVVMKFGGTSLQSPEHIRKVAQYVLEATRKGVRPVVVVSAMGQTTDQILQLFRETCPGAPSREIDQGLATGEQVSAALLAGALCDLAKTRAAKSLVAHQMRITAVGAHRRARIRAIQGAAQMIKDVQAGQILVCAGFQGVTDQGEVLTLGRGGSDTTAVALAHALKASCEIFTDVNGVYAVDPRIVPNARRFRFITYPDMRAMSAAGAGVLMERAVMLAQRLGIPLRVKLSPSLGNTDEGTLVSSRDDRDEVIEVDDWGMTGLAIKSNIAVIAVNNIPNKPGEAARIFGLLEDVVIGDAIQGPSGETATISCWISEEDAERVGTAVPNCEIQGGAACLTLVSSGMKEGHGYMARATAALARADANIQMIATAGDCILLIVRNDDVKKAACEIAAEFGLCETGSS